ncbi:hypothetical protein ACF0H5_004379 [Mactra antiquata]
MIRSIQFLTSVALEVEKKLGLYMRHGGDKPMCIYNKKSTTEQNSFKEIARIIKKKYEGVIAIFDNGLSKPHQDSYMQVLSTYDTISNDEAINYFGNVTSSMKDWTFQNKIPCPTRIIGNRFTNKSRRMFSIRCTTTTVDAIFSDTVYSDEVQEMKFGDPCLNRYIQKCCLDEQRIPNVVHYVWYKRGELSFVPFLSFLAVIRFVKPCVIVFHGAAPYGKYWDAFTYLWPRVILLKREAPKTVFKKPLGYVEHASDIMRIEALINYGGIYMDTDTILVKSVDKLRNYSCVMSEQTRSLLGSAFIMSEKSGTFVNEWMGGYRSHYKPTSYIYNAMRYPYMLMKRNPDIIHTEYGTISRPYKMRHYSIFNGTKATYNWSGIYGIHCYIRLLEDFIDENTIRQMNTTFGSIARHVFYGNKELCIS